MQKILNFINGKFEEPASGKFLDNYNPAKGEVYSLIPASNAEDVERAVAAAEKAFPRWSRLTAEQRGHYLRELGRGILQKLEVFVQAESIDTGKPVSLARAMDIPRGARNLEFFADISTQLQGETFRSNSHTTNVTDYFPLGVVACITPWNLPLLSFTWKIAPALAAGNTVVAKPSEMTPMTAYLLCQVAEEIGLPRGVLNVVFGTGPAVGAPLVSHPQIKAVSFTGSTATGKSIAQATAGNFKKISLELGGKNPNIIFADCDFEKAVDTSVRSSFLNQGEICLCGSRIFVEKSIYEKFKNALVEKTKALRQGDPLMNETEQGAVVSKQHMEKVMSYIDLAKAEGGKILTGGRALGGAGYFIEPTLFEGIAYTARTNQEEIFGPVATLIPFETEDEVIKMANSTRYGLSASVWTRDLGRAQRLSRRLEAGVVWINTWMFRDLRTPFGGVKESGYGREGGLEALKFFSEVKNTCIQYEEKEND